MQKDLLLLNANTELPFGAKAITLSCTKDSYDSTFMQIFITYSDGYKEGEYWPYDNAILVWPGQSVNKSRPGTVITEISLEPFDVGGLTNKQEVQKVFNIKEYDDAHTTTWLYKPITLVEHLKIEFAVTV